MNDMNSRQQSSVIGVSRLTTASKSLSINCTVCSQHEQQLDTSETSNYRTMHQRCVSDTDTSNVKLARSVAPSLDRQRTCTSMLRFTDSTCCHFYSARNARIASAVLAAAIPSVRLSVTRRYCVKTAARSTVQFAPLDSKMCLVL